MYAVILDGKKYQSEDPRAIAVEMAYHAVMTNGLAWDFASTALRDAGMDITQTMTVQCIFDGAVIAAVGQWNSQDHKNFSFFDRKGAVRQAAAKWAIARFDAAGNRRVGYGLRQLKKMSGGKLPDLVFIQDGQYVPYTADVWEMTCEDVNAAPVVDDKAAGDDVPTDATPTTTDVEALTDDVKARYDAAWALVLAYGAEIRRRIGEVVVQSEEIPF